MNLDTLKQNKEIKYIFKLPNSYYEEGFEYIIVGNVEDEIPNSRIFTTEQWFDKINSGSLLPYVCSILPKKYKVKEYLNIYSKPDVLKLRRLITSLDGIELIQECLWGIQVIKEFKVNRPDVFKDTNSLFNAVDSFYEAVDPIYRMQFNGK
jgi:hypothetical protein